MEIDPKGTDDDDMDRFKTQQKDSCKTQREDETMVKAAVIDFQEFRLRRETQRQQQVENAHVRAMVPIIVWYPVQWVWVWPYPNVASVTA